ncbi:MULTISPECIES: ABC transporter permease [Rhizobium]|uniref:ABC transporter permease n=1 Tax=Rhizobium wuzhouense TaxID=1986026 RepID=A0ABX5NSM0_9HYPH|nr:MULTISPECIES: ABC transporter permease [Rhizobium]PYB71849.1 ABC transporter permease [Rhizobium wuzhouense]RKE79392.1 peptide/nickel transport system permease protein [Rhizobium sp. AG855]
MIKSIFRVLGRRLISVVPVFMIVTILVFVTLRILPVDPAQMSLPPSATIAQVEAKREEMGLNKPIWQQYSLWFQRTIVGDLGDSAQYRMPTSSIVLERLPATIELALSALMFAIIVGVAGGIVIFSVRGTIFESAGMVITSVIMALPDFLLALLFILIFGMLIPIFPVNGRLDPGMQVPTHTGFLLIDSLLTGDLSIFASVLHHFALPVIALGLAFSPTIIRVLHSSLLNTYQESYIRQARLRGLSDREILFGQALKNAILPVVILVGTQFGGLFGGTLLVEMIFSFPGLGNLMVKAMQTADLSVIMAIALIYCATTLLFNSLADAAAYLLNPKLRSK